MKLGLILEGGASRTFYTNGVLDALIDAEIRADYVIGSSAGIANGISYVSWQRGRSQKIGEEYVHDPRYMGARHLLRPGNRSLYNLRFVFDEIPNKLVPFDYDALAAYPGCAEACVTNLATGKPEYFPVDGKDRTWQLLIASCALPLLFQPVRLESGLYMDGGITNPVPYDAALAAGCDKLLIVLTRPRDYRKPQERAITLAMRRYRRYPAFCRALEQRADVYNTQRRSLFELEQAGKAFLICPDALDIGRTERDAKVLHEIYCHGLEVTNRAMPALRRYLEEPT